MPRNINLRKSRSTTSSRCNSQRYKPPPFFSPSLSLLATVHIVGTLHTSSTFASVSRMNKNFLFVNHTSHNLYLNRKIVNH
ncbi:hypothetical protein BT67DRAFT_30829 [Trichocladium antarcticum]|uniref:Uncharacterized protein n=1 Tax=Trichocladium antarcticum TaxID=1450529 RepID=A0AAN6ZIE1_9PEZI|nr:hypothetical protein BT67DRAFT_30829 [Trichocladium antarcticum]